MPPEQTPMFSHRMVTHLSFHSLQVGFTAPCLVAEWSESNSVSSFAWTYYGLTLGPRLLLVPLPFFPPSHRQKCFATAHTFLQSRYTQHCDVAYEAASLFRGGPRPPLVCFKTCITRGYMILASSAGNQWPVEAVDCLSSLTPAHENAMFDRVGAECLVCFVWVSEGEI